MCVMPNCFFYKLTNPTKTMKQLYEIFQLIVYFLRILGTRKTQATHEYDEATRSQKTLR